MATHAEILERWGKDCHLDLTNLPAESARTPTLHHRYLTMLTAEETRLKEMVILYDKLYAEKEEFYLQGMNEVFKAKGWEMRPAGKPLKQDMKWVMPQDEDLVEAKIKLAQQETKVSALVKIVNEINNRSYHINNANKSNEFANGGR